MSVLVFVYYKDGSLGEELFDTKDLAYQWIDSIDWEDSDILDAVIAN